MTKNHSDRVTWYLHSRMVLGNDYVIPEAMALRESSISCSNTILLHPQEEFFPLLLLLQQPREQFEHHRDR